MKYIGFGAIIIGAIVVGGIIFRVPNNILDALMEPGASVASGLPGGFMHNPLSILLAIAVQVLLTAGLLRLIVFIGAITIWRKDRSL